MESRFRKGSLEQARLDLITSKFQNHFISNTFNRITSLGKSGNHKIDLFLELILKLNQHTISYEDKLAVDLRSELEFAELYVSLLNLENSFRISFHNNVRHVEMQLYNLLPMTMQVVLESIVGFLSPSDDHTDVYVSIVDRSLLICCRDNTHKELPFSETAYDHLQYRYQCTIDETIERYSDGKLLTVVIPLDDNLSLN